jgi:hypothetical protein
LVCELKGKAKDNGITLDQAIASTLGHEIRHGEQENIALPDGENYETSPKEIDARSVGNAIIDDYKTNNFYEEKKEKVDNRAFWNAVFNWINSILQ